MRVTLHHALAAVLLGACVSTAARADGGFLGSSLAPWEPAQAACILWDEDAGRQDLILQVAYDFEGPPEEFAWIVPVPAEPTLSVVDASTFPDLYELTRPRRRERSVECLTRTDVMYAEPGNDEVEVVSEMTVGIYEALVVSATDAGALRDSLDAWGFVHAANEASLDAALEFYVAKEWFFVAMRTDSVPGDPAEWGWNHGSLDPIRLAFDASEPVYPMRISQLSTIERSRVDLFIVAGHRMEHDALTIRSANAVNADELRAIHDRYPSLDGLIAEGDFVTRLGGYVSHGAMDDDFVLRRALVDDEYLQIHYSGWPLAESIGLVALLGLGIRRRRRGGTLRPEP